MDDVVQNIFIVIHAKLSTLQRPESIRSWIYGIARRTALRHFRTQRHASVFETTLAWLEEARAPVQPTPQELAEQRDRLRLLAGLLSELDEAKREVLMLAELDELTPFEIADALEIPLNTVYSRLRAARAQFDAALSRQRARDDRRRQP